MKFCLQVSPCIRNICLHLHSSGGSISKKRTQVASQLVGAFDSLLDAYARIGECMPMLEAVDKLFSQRNHDHVKQILAHIYEDILKFHGRAIVFFKDRSEYHI